MITDLKPYPAYKDSGVEWLGDIPEGWELRRLGYASEPPVNGVWGNDPDGVNDIFCVRVADFDRERLITKTPIPTMRAVTAAERKRRLLRRGDLLLEKSGGGDQQPVGVVVEHIADIPAISSNFVARMRPRSGFVGRYLTYLHCTLYSMGVNVRSIKQTTGIQNLDGDEYLSERVPLATTSDQKAIACFLDYVDSRIRLFIATKERLIKLLEKEKQGVIHHAITRGFDPNVHFKPSGVDWLGDAPAHWEVRRLKWAIRLQRGYDLPTDERIPGSIPVISSGGIVGTHTEARARGPSVVIGRYGSTGSVYFVDGDFWPHNTSLFVTHFYGNEPGWVFYLLQVIPKAELAAKSAVPGIDRKDLHNILISVPPAQEQRALFHGLTQQTETITNAVLVARRQIDLLREYRTRLISDVVTGKLDVREAAASLPEDPDAEDPALDERLEKVAAG